MRPQVNDQDSGILQQAAEWKPDAESGRLDTSAQTMANGNYIAGRSPSGSWSLGSLIEETAAPQPPDSA